MTRRSPAPTRTAGATAIVSDLEQQALGPLDALLDPHQELHRFATIEQAIILASARYMMGRISTLPSIATGRSTMLCRPRMPVCGGLRIGVDSIEP